MTAQFLAHRLSIKRDRRNQERARLNDAVVTAATALFTLSGDKPVGEYAEEPHPASVAAMFSELRDPRLVALQERTLDALYVLTIHFGKEHWIVEEYREVVAVSHDAQREVVRHFAIPIDNEDERLANLPSLMKATGAAELARDKWTNKAREYARRCKAWKRPVSRSLAAGRLASWAAHLSPVVPAGADLGERLSQQPIELRQRRPIRAGASGGRGIPGLNPMVRAV